ncbi:MAG: hypothetical protein WCI29_09130 [Actinomycetes bacterium]|jgi:hypothetical protein
MDLTLLRRTERSMPLASRNSAIVQAASGPVGVLVASSGLAAGFVYLVSDLVTRIG